ncbi:hypothetical protein NP233_g466 [Leucocoprinus birnbaumii]|uniref:Ricin B lectin domain-containing protein n=1 Tax=Leucocoprinus birnbaumii TaxID=56174 RepID=A0AAD5W4A4_9AGAR|nr:hypothetical protein NP233_g466 [Leucocoprinus birnbaumii]
MLFRTSLHFIATALSAVAASPAAHGRPHKLAPGLYRINNHAAGTWARNTPGPGHQGPWRSMIIMTTDAITGYQVWNISHYEEGYMIRNHGSGNLAFSTGHEGNLVEGFSDSLTKWYIEPAGGDSYKIQYPNRDLVWTLANVDDFWKTVALEPAQGTDSQLFQFTY